MSKIYKRIIFTFLLLIIMSITFVSYASSATPRNNSRNVGNVTATVTVTVVPNATATVNPNVTTTVSPNVTATVTVTVVPNATATVNPNGTNGTSPKITNGTNDTNGTNGTSPKITNIDKTGITSSTVNISFSVDQQDAKTIIYYGATLSLGTPSSWDNSTSKNRNIMLSGLRNSTGYNFSIRAYNGTNGSYYNDSSIYNFTTTNVSTPPVSKIVPKIISTTPENSKHTTVNTPINFTVSFDDVVNVTWKINGTSVKNESSVKYSYYANNAAVVGTYNVTVSGNNNNGNASHSWDLVVDPELFGTGNRIWDGSKNMSTTYMWNSFSFAGFYYDIDTNMSTEELVIKDIKRTIDVGDIIYRASPQEVNFGYSNFGKYQVIGFMANKYFAGYKNTTIPGPTSNFNDISTLSQGQLHKVLLDDDSKRTVSVGGTIVLQEGYVLKATDIDMTARTMLLVLLKDGVEVDSSPLSADQTYVYEKRVGNVESLPIILVRFDNVFSGQELQTAFLKGIFQISETVTSIRSGDTYGLMSVVGVDSNNVTMENKQTVGLSPAAKIDLMGDLKIIVADDSNKLRFALSVERKGDFEVRGTVYPITKEWTPMNFGLNVMSADGTSEGKDIGFYYNLDDDVGTEDLKINSISGNSIPEGGLIYSTSPQQVSFTYSNFGKYQVVGFMADKYFAGYSGHTIPGPTSSFSDISALSQGQLHKILIDDDTKRTISVGGTVALQEGYVLKATDIDLTARTMLLVLLKDGVEVDSSPLSADQTYVYEKRVGNVESLPLIMVRFDNVFSGQELQTAFLKGLFQISETPTSIKVGDTFGNMEVKSVNKDSLTMSNSGSIGLSRGNTVDIMGNVKFRVADSGDVRFYPSVSVTSNMTGTALAVNIPSKAIGGDAVSINVTAGGVPIEGASITISPETGLTSKDTNKDGIAIFTFPKRSKGIYIVMATKTGYESANKTIDIQQYIEGTLSINVPIVIDQSQNIPIQVISNGTIVDNATVTYDNVTIGTTNNNGNLSYVFDKSGSHTIGASKSGYIGVSRDVDVRAPFSEFLAQDINISSTKIISGEEIVIKSNITNSGTKGETKSIDLIVNDTAVENISVSLNPKEIKEINFTYMVTLPEGNYTIEILEQKGLIEVQKKQTSNIYIMAIIATIVGLIAIYGGTTKKGKDMINRLLKND
jgi:S-layer protein (TIGR01567 family)